MGWWGHAFAVPTEREFAPSVAEQALAGRLAEELNRRGMTLPAVVLLEAFRPLGSLAAQGLRFSHPWFAAILQADGLKQLAGLLERPGAVDWLIDRLQATAPSDQPSLVPHAGHHVSPV